MNEAILVFDKMPNSCDECEVRCTGYTAKDYAQKGIKRPSWCPIRPLPQKKGELIRCRDCKHKPTIDGVYEDGFDIVFPDMRCPCQCEDGWYNWMPDDDWYCANAERKEEFKKRYSGETE